MGRRRGDARPDRARRRAGHDARSTSTSSTRATRRSATRTAWDEVADPRPHRPARTPPRTSCTPPRLNASRTPRAERRAELRLEAGKQARHNVAVPGRDVQRSEVGHRAAHRVRGPGGHGPRGRRRGRPPRRGASTAQAVEDAIWAATTPRLDYLAEHAGYSRIGHHGGAAGPVRRRPRLGRRVVLPARLPRPRPAAAHPQRDPQPRPGPGRAVAHARLAARIHRFRAAAAAVGGAHHRGAPHPRARGAVRDPPGRQGPRGRRRRRTRRWTCSRSRRRAITAKTAELIDAFEAQFGRDAERPRARPALHRQATFATRQAKSHDGETREQLLDRVGPRAARRGRRRPARRRPTTSSRLAGRTAAGGAGVVAAARCIETALADVQSTQGRLDPRGPDPRDHRRAARPPRRRSTAPTSPRCSTGSPTRRSTLAVPLDAARPGDDALPDELRLADGALGLRRARRAAATPPPSTSTPNAPWSPPPPAAARRALPRRGRRAVRRRGCAESGHRARRRPGRRRPRGPHLRRAGRDPRRPGRHRQVLRRRHARHGLARPRPVRTAPPRRVFGLATSQIATDVLADEGLTARNIARWLATQDRLADGHRRAPTTTGVAAARRRPGRGRRVRDDRHRRPRRDPRPRRRGRREAAARRRPPPARRRRRRRRRWTCSPAPARRYELTEARRFAARRGKRAASLRLRDGDDDRARATTTSTAGSSTPAPSSDAERVRRPRLARRHPRRAATRCSSSTPTSRPPGSSAALRAELVRLGRVAEHGVPLGLQGTYAGVGDLVAGPPQRLGPRRASRATAAARSTARPTASPPSATTARSIVAPVAGRGPDGEVARRADGAARRATSPSTSRSATPRTVHAAQGLTVDTSHIVATPAHQRAPRSTSG